MTVDVLGRGEDSDGELHYIAAEEYDAWFRAKVHEALQDESSGLSDWQDHETVLNDVRRAVGAIVAERRRIEQRS